MASYTWVDIDPDAHTATLHKVARLHDRHPLLLPPEAINTRLPMDARTITPELFIQASPAGVDLIMASPPMIPQHFPKAHRGQEQSARATVGQIRYLIHQLAASREDGIEFVWDTPVGSPLPAHVKKMMGPSTVQYAPKCGSGTHRPTHLWQNLLPKEEMDEASSNLNYPPHMVNEMLNLAGLG